MSDLPSPTVAEDDLNPLLALTPSLLHHVASDARKQLIAYLKRWDEHATLLRYLDVWLAAHGALATLRQERAEALIKMEQAGAALDELDTLDQERGVTAGRRGLRIAALIALEDWATLERLLDPPSAADRGQMLMAQGRFAEARRVFAEASALRDGPPTLREVRATLLAGEFERARALLVERQATLGDARSTVPELRLRQEVATACGDDALRTLVTTELAEMEATERTRMIEMLGLGAHEELEIVPDVPATVEHDIEAPAEALHLLREHWGYPAFRGGQAATISQVLRGQSTLAVLPTGAGKSLTYQLPALLHTGATVVVSPLIALMKDQIDGLPAAVRDQAIAINSSLSAAEVAQRLRDVAAGRYRLVYVAPERLRQQNFVQALRGIGIACFVVDEAHCVSLWGLSFRPDYLFLKRVIEELGNPPVLALTATATPDTRDEIATQFGELQRVTASVFRSNLSFSVVQVANVDAKTDALLEQCRAIDGPILVYARARERCEELADLLRRKGISAGYYHAQVEDRARAQESFMRGDVQVLVATVAFGMGIDKPDIRAIIHYNLPQSVEAYYQEAGRAGRDGALARCVLLYTPGDKGQLTSWLRQDALSRDDLRTVYRALRDRAAHGYARMSADELRYAIPRLEETQSRVALGMLERAGLILRHFDLPQSLRVTLMQPSDDPAFLRLVEALSLELRLSSTIDPLAHAPTLGMRPDQLEGEILRWSGAGHLRVDHGPRDLLLELLPAPPDTPARIEAMLDEYATRQEARIEAMVGYAKGLSCRHRALAAHFGERLPACGNACDVCSGTRTTVRGHARPAPVFRRSGPRLGAAEAVYAALRTLRDLPYSVGRTGLMHILTGSNQSPRGSDRFVGWSKLDAWTQKEALRLIDDLVGEGLIARNERGAFPMLELTTTGLQSLPDEA